MKLRMFSTYTLLIYKAKRILNSCDENTVLEIVITYF